MQSILPILVIVGLVVTFLILILGILTMNRGGDFNKKYGNFLMRMRIGSQAITIIFFILYAIFK